MQVKHPIHVKHLGLQPFESVWQQMKAFTDTRTGSTADEIWVVEHPDVFTLGQAGKAEHLLNPGQTPVMKCDRGGQVTWHGPGQLVVYLLLDLGRAGINVRQLVSGIEAAVMALLSELGIESSTRKGAPGVYVDGIREPVKGQAKQAKQVKQVKKGAKIAALGLRIRKGCSYHGLSLNVDADLQQYARINPCGMAGLEVTSLKELGVPLPTREAALRQVADQLLPLLARHLGLTEKGYEKTCEKSGEKAL